MLRLSQKKYELLARMLSKRWDAESSKWKRLEIGGIKVPVFAGRAAVQVITDGIKAKFELKTDHNGMSTTLNLRILLAQRINEAIDTGIYFSLTHISHSMLL